uniref:GIY-YIG endonuclease n=1 Tax=Sphaerobolus stellatus TaxID=68786 RepID=A0A7D4Z7V2_9AGAM|nr:GIY-YIG endonuclease [Sphaerobolus stellatus]
MVRKFYNKKGIVYGIENNIDHKFYIGSTSNANSRFYTHFLRPVRSNEHLQNAIRLIGLSNFTLHIFSVIELSDSLSRKEKIELISPLEQKYIDLFPKGQLYNFLSKAYTSLWFKYSKESKLLMSSNSKGKNLGRSPINKGIKLTDIEKKRLKSKSIHRYKPVYFYDEMNNLITMYESFNEARRQEKCRANDLLSCIKEGTLFRGFIVTYEKKGPAFSS